MTILELITAQCGVQGVDKKYAARIEKISGITEEKDGNIIAAVKNFKENILPAIQEAEASAEKAVEEYEKKYNLKDGKTVEKKEEAPDEPKLPDNLDPSIKAIIENQNKMMVEMQKTVTTLADTQKKTSTLEIVKAKLKGKVDDKFIEKYAKRANLDVEDIDDEIERVAKEFTDDKQAFINDAISSGSYQPADGGITDNDFDDYVKRTEAPESAFEGKKV